ncbi:MAG: YdhR family protein [Candidatus Zixiibacteriota bacterium]|nr:MAG: YdhR family protein [candidate division Zixibacteria bacterium]
MADKILQINFRYSVSPDEYTAAVTDMADDFAAVDGLKWKVWIMNEKRREAGGIYLFNNQASLDAFLEGPLAAAVTSHPALVDFSVRQFDVMPDITAITRGPV